MTTIDIAADSTPAQLNTSQLKSTDKQKIISVIPKAKPKTKFWNLGKHLLYSGSAQEPEFRAQLPKSVSLNIGFPHSQSWDKETLFPVTAKSMFIFYSAFQDLDLVTLRNIVQRSIELCTESEEEVLFSFLPYPEMLVLADNLKCRCYVSEPDFERCQDIVTFWKSSYIQS